VNGEKLPLGHNKTAGRLNNTYVNHIIIPPMIAIGHLKGFFSK